MDHPRIETEYQKPMQCAIRSAGPAILYIMFIRHTISIAFDFLRVPTTTINFVTRKREVEVEPTVSGWLLVTREARKTSR